MAPSYGPELCAAIVFFFFDSTYSGFEMTVPTQDQAQQILGDVGGLLHDLTEVQTALLSVLQKKREAMAKGAIQQLSELQPIEEEINGRLKICFERRSEILERGQSQGVSAVTLAEMTNQLSDKSHGEIGNLEEQFQESRDRVRELQLEHLTNWVIAQKSLLHVSQILEIVATGGKIKPTYGKDDFCARGALVDHEA
jgi:hypothetical protein